MPPGQVYHFGDFCLDVDQQLLFRGKDVVPLAPKAFETLFILVENRGRIVSKDLLLKQVWPDTFVEEGSLTRNISVLRKVLGDTGNGSTVIETIPKRGYRFVAPIETAPPVTQESASGPTIAETHEPPPRRHLGAWLSVIVLVALALAGFLLRDRLLHRTPHRTMLLVLPVQNLTGDPEREYMADGFTEEIIAQLGSLDPQQLGVIARTSAMTYKGSTKTVGRIGKEVGADYIVESSLRNTGNTLRVTVQLVRADDQGHVWSQSYDRAMGHVMLMQNEIAGAVAQAVKIRLTDAQRMRLANASPVNPEAYEDYLKGRFYWNTRSEEGLYKSIDYYNQVLQQDPVDARAYAGLADSYNMLVFYGYDTSRETKNKATVAARKALELDSTLAEAHAALAYANLFWWWEWPDAQRGFQRAIELNSNYVPAHHWYALDLAIMGRRSESIEEMRKAEELDPLSPGVRVGSAFVKYLARRYDDAMADCDQALKINPNFMAGHYVLGLSYEAKGDFGHAIPELQKAWEISGQHATVYLAALGHAYALAGRKDQAERILTELGESDPRRAGGSAQALIWAGLGDTQKEVEWLRRARDANDPQLIWLGVDPRWDSVRFYPDIRSLSADLQGARPQ